MIMRMRTKTFRWYFAIAALPPLSAFYTMFNVGEYTFAPYKVVWAEQGEFGCAVIGTLSMKSH
jgi:hypothetical protein